MSALHLTRPQRAYANQEHGPPTLASHDLVVKGGRDQGREGGSRNMLRNL
jgi:hypothetical protein